MNEFSILCRVLGSLYYRQPQDPLLVPLFSLIREGQTGRQLAAGAGRAAGASAEKL